MGDILTYCDWCMLKKLTMVMCAEINEGLGLPDMVSTGAQSECMTGKCCNGSLQLERSHEDLVSCNENTL